MHKRETQLLQQLCEIRATSGDESKMKQFILDYVRANRAEWLQQPEIIEGPEFQDCVLLKFGNPRTAVFSHMDSIGFTVRYNNQLVPVGGPEAENGYHLVGADSLGEIACELRINDEGNLFYDFPRAIDRGTALTFECHFRETRDYIQSCYLDNRLGVYCALQLASKLKDGVIAFSCWEEHGGGSVPYLVKYVYEELKVRQALICDITWVTEGVHHGKGVAISMRDKHIPRRAYLNRVIELAHQSGIAYQLEVEGAGSSDGREVQLSSYPMDWCFVGAPEDNVHSPNEKVHKRDIQAMIDMYVYLLDNL